MRDGVYVLANLPQVNQSIDNGLGRLLLLTHSLPLRMD